MSNGPGEWEPPPQQQVGRSNEDADQRDPPILPANLISHPSHVPTPGQTPLDQNGVFGQQSFPNDGVHLAGPKVVQPTNSGMISWSATFKISPLRHLHGIGGWTQLYPKPCNKNPGWYEYTIPSERDMGTESQMPTSGETALSQNSFIGQQSLSNNGTRVDSIDASGNSFPPQRPSIEFSHAARAAQRLSINAALSGRRNFASSLGTSSLQQQVSKVPRFILAGINRNLGNEKMNCVPYGTMVKISSMSQRQYSAVLHDTTLNVAHVHSPIQFRPTQYQEASISSQNLAESTAAKTKKPVAKLPAPVSNDVITRQQYSVAEADQILYDSDFNVDHCETVVCETITSSGTQSLEEETLLGSQGKYENNTAIAPVSNQDNTMKLPPVIPSSNSVQEASILSDSDSETERLSMNQHRKVQPREVSRSSVSPENLASSDKAHEKRVATSSTTESDYLIANTHCSPSQVIQWSPEQSLGGDVQVADGINTTDGLNVNTEKGNTSEHLAASSSSDDDGSVEAVANSVPPTSALTLPSTSTLTTKQLLPNSSLSQSTQEIDNLSESDANTEAPSSMVLNTCYDEDFGSSPFFDSGTLEPETQNIGKPTAKSIEADDPNTLDVPESSNALNPSFPTDGHPVDADEEDLYPPSPVSSTQSLVDINDILYQSDDDFEALPPKSLNILSSQDFAPFPIPSEDDVRGNSEPRVLNSSNNDVSMEDNQENEQVANQHRDIEHNALVKLRDKDPIMDNTYPMKAAKHVIRRSTSDDEEEPQCLKCGKGPSRYRPLLQCQGIMNGHVHGNEEDPEKKSFEDRCECVFHIDCLKKYNAGDFNLQYSARAECQGKLQCSLHCCEKCNLERHKQSAYQGDIIECDLCYRAFHSLSCLPAGCEVITKEIDGHKYRRIICDAHSSDETTPGKHIEVCSALECKITEEDKESIQLQKCKTCVRSFHVECKIAQDPKLIPNFSKRCDFCVLDDTMRMNTPVLAFCPSIRKFHLGTITDWSLLPASKQPREKRGKMLVKWERKNLPSVPEFSPLPVQFGAELIQSYCKRFENDFNGRAEEMLNEHKKRVSENRPNFCKVVAEEGTSCRKFHTKSTEDKKKIKDSQTTCSSSCTGNCLDHSCDNFFDYLECPENCKVDCQNKQLRNGKINSKIKIGTTKMKGLGVFATSEIVAGEFLAPYVGELIDEKERNRRKRAVRESRDVQGNHYMMKQGEQGMTVDAAAYGNIARYFNHSCVPNAEATKKKMWVSTAGGNHYYVERVYIEAKTNIKAEEEITISYGMENLAYLTTCHCGSPKCTKTMGKAQNEKGSNDSQSTSQWSQNTAYYRSFVVDQPPPCLLLTNIKLSCFINSSLNLLYKAATFRKWILSTPNHSRWIDALKDVFDKTQSDAVRVRELMAPHFHIGDRHDAMEAIENIVRSVEEEQIDNGGIPSLACSYQMEDVCSAEKCRMDTRNDNNGFLTNIPARDASLQTLINEAFPGTLHCNSCDHGEITRRYKLTSDSEYHIVSLIREATQRLIRTPGSVIISLFGAQWRIAGFTRFKHDKSHYDAYIRDGDSFYCVDDSRVHRHRISAKRMRLADFGVSSILLERITDENLGTSSGTAPIPDIQTDGRSERNQQGSVDTRGKRSIEKVLLPTEDRQQGRKRQKTAVDTEGLCDSVEQVALTAESVNSTETNSQTHPAHSSRTSEEQQISGTAVRNQRQSRNRRTFG